METAHNIDEVADQYRSEGYKVVVAPASNEVPDFARGNGIDLIAYKGEEKVIIEVTTREDLQRDPNIVQMARIANEQPGWRLDLVVLNPADSQDKVPLGALEPPLEQIDRTLESAERLVETGELPSALMVAWAALEAALRQSARSADITIKSYSALFLLGALYSEGLLERGEFDSLSEALKIRNTVAHGMIAPGIDPSVPRSVVSIARKLIVDQTAQTRQGVG